MMNNKYRSIRLASFLGIVGNLFLFVIKGGIGFTTGSQAMIADFFNSFSDIFSSIMTFIGNKIASKPRDNDHNLGHGKAEYIYSMLISIVMLILAYNSFKGSLFSLINNNKFHFSIFLVFVSIITIFVKLFLYIFTRKLSLKYNNILIRANSIDHRNDAVISFCTLISIILSLFNIYVFDVIVGLCISIWIFISAVSIFKESYDVLMDKCIDDETREKVYKIILSHADIKKFNHFNSTPVGYRYQISFSIFVDGNLSTFDSHEIADKLEDEIIEKIPSIYLVVIHVNPV